MKRTSELEEFDQLFENYRQRFIQFAYSYVRDIVVAEDFVSEAMIYYWEHKDSLSSETNPPAYILTTIKHKCLNYLQHQRTHIDVLERLRDHVEWEFTTRIATLKACEPNELFAKEIQEIIVQTLDQLPQKTREIFSLSKEQDFSYKEIAKQYGISAKGVEFHVSKAMKALRNALQDYVTCWFI